MRIFGRKERSESAGGGDPGSPAQKPESLPAGPPPPELESLLAQRRGFLEGIGKRLDQLDDFVTKHERELELLEDRLEALKAELVLAIAEGIERVDRAERRVKATVQSARRRMERAGYVDDALEAEAEQLELEDARGGGGHGVPPVYDDVADDQPAFDPTGLPGDWSALGR